MNYKDNILVLGYTGRKSGIMEGQSVKTRNVVQLFSEIGMNVSEFDTESFRYDYFAIFKLLRSLIKCNKLCLFPAYNNLKYLFPILFVLSKIFRYEIYYFTIGGRLHIYLQSLPVHKWMLKKIKCVFYETHLLGSYLQNLHGLTNIEYFPNFKYVRFTPTKHHEQGHLKFVFLARITPEKGLDVIFSYADYLTEKQRTNVIVDLYGMVDNDYRPIFEEHLKKYSFVSYKGVAKQEEIPTILEQYDCMLFPTHYPTEGIPGSILDAYIAGIPVVATNWTYASELIDDNITGIIVPFDNCVDTFINACESLLVDESKLDQMKDMAHRRYENYHADYVKNILLKYFE